MIWVCVVQTLQDHLRHHYLEKIPFLVQCLFLVQSQYQVVHTHLEHKTENSGSPTITCKCDNCECSQRALIHQCFLFYVFCFFLLENFNIY